MVTINGTGSAQPLKSLSHKIIDRHGNALFEWVFTANRALSYVNKDEFGTRDKASPPASEFAIFGSFY